MTENSGQLTDAGATTLCCVKTVIASKAKQSNAKRRSGQNRGILR